MLGQHKNDLYIWSKQKHMILSDKQFDEDGDLTYVYTCEVKFKVSYSSKEKAKFDKFCDDNFYNVHTELEEEFDDGTGMESVVAVTGDILVSVGQYDDKHEMLKMATDDICYDFRKVSNYVEVVED